MGIANTCAFEWFPGVKCPNPASSIGFLSKGPTAGMLNETEIPEEKAVEMAMEGEAVEEEEEEAENMEEEGSELEEVGSLSVLRMHSFPRIVFYSPWHSN